MVDVYRGSRHLGRIRVVPETAAGYNLLAAACDLVRLQPACQVTLSKQVALTVNVKK